VRELVDFFRAVWHHWLAIVGGAAVATLQMCFQTQWSKTITLSLFAIGLLLACFLAWRDQQRKALEFESLSKPRLDVTYMEDGQCNLSGSATNSPHFRVRLFLHGFQLIEHLFATVEAIRVDGIAIPLRESVHLRFNHAKTGESELQTMSPQTSELLDIFRVESKIRFGAAFGEAPSSENRPLCLCLASGTNSFNPFCCQEPNRTYEVDVRVGSSIVPKDFTFVIPWTGVFGTTHPYIKQPS
jgi:hypothetical protein